MALKLYLEDIVAVGLAAVGSVWLVYIHYESDQTDKRALVVVAVNTRGVYPTTNTPDLG